MLQPVGVHQIDSLFAISPYYLQLLLTSRHRPLRRLACRLNQRRSFDIAYTSVTINR